MRAVRRARRPVPRRGDSTEGRLWAFWGRIDLWIFAARSNKKATQVRGGRQGRPPEGHGTASTASRARAPHPAAPSTSSLWRRARTCDIDNFHQRIRPGITLTVKVLGDGEVRFKTRDAGAKLDTTIRFAGKTKQTGDDGKVVFSAEPGKRTAKATRAGYHPAKRTVKVE